MKHFTIIVMLLLGVGILGAGVYGLFFVNTQGKSLAQHSEDLWQATSVQHKINVIRQNIKSKLKQARSTSNSEPAAAQKDGFFYYEPERLTDKDRNSLQQLLANQ